MKEAVKLALEAVDDKKGIDVVLLDISKIASFASYFLLCSGDSARQIQAISDQVEEKLRGAGFKPNHIEGYSNAEWVLMDYLDLVVHIFSKKSRAFYDLERLWRDARRLDPARLLESDAKRSRGRKKAK